MSEIAKSIYRFIHDPDLKRIKEICYNGGVMDILKISHLELPHSNFLSWLFDSSSEHGLHCAPASFLLDLIIYNIKCIKENYDNNDKLKYFKYLQGKEDIDIEKFYRYIILHDYNIISANCKREKNNIDLIIQIDLKYAEHSQKVNIIIENKIDAPLTDDQLTRYKNHILETYTDSINLFVFLAPDPKKYEYNKNYYIPLSYQELYEHILVPILQKKHITSDIVIYINEYIKCLKYKLIIMSSEDKKLIESFLNNHDDLIDFLIDFECENSSTEEDKEDKEALKKLKKLKEIRAKRIKYKINGDDGGPYIRHEVVSIIIKNIINNEITTFEELKSLIKDSGIRISQTERGRYIKIDNLEFDVWVDKNISADEIKNIIKFAETHNIIITKVRT